MPSMPLALGDKLGPYEITALLGEGGMGEVYKARDTRLDRTVALKVSKAQFTDRFEREARAVAALNHPNICQLYDVGPNYLVMEFVEGVELKGPLPLEKALEVSHQILDALDAAHKRGITHRDLKPANVLVAKQGIKLLDFGLAKQEVQLAPTDATLTKALTGEGQLLGTLQYMSPEQTQGQNADARSDIFAFGCVFHELITGKRAFNGASVAAVIAAILKDEPEPRAIPDAIDRVIKTCLAKDADARFQSAADCKRALLWATGAKAPSAKENWLWPAVAAAALTGLAFVALKPAPKPRPPTPVSFQVDPPEGYRFLPSSVRISPDGQAIAAILLGAPNHRSIWVRPLRAVAFTRLPGTDGAEFFFWSPDSSEIGFVDGARLRRTKAVGGPVETICTEIGILSATWGAGGTIVFARGDGPLRVVRPGSATPADLTKFDQSKKQTSHASPVFLPDGDRYLYRVYSSEERHQGVYLSSLSKGEAQRLPVDSVRIGTFMNPPGIRLGGNHLIYRKGESIVAQRLAPGAGDFEGDPIVLAESTRSITSSLSDTGVLTHIPVDEAVVNGDLIEVNRKGERLRSFGPKTGVYGHVALSPDGRRLAADLRDPATGVVDVWTIDLATAVSTRLTFPPMNGSIPAWSADGERIFFTIPRQINAVSASAGGSPRKIADAESHHMHASPDGNWLMFEKDRTTALSSQLATVSLAGDSKPQLVFSPGQFTVEPQFSPDGKWFAYSTSNASDRDVFVESFPLGKGKWQISRNGGGHPRWRRDGKEIFFVQQREIFAVDITTGGDGILRPGAPKVLFTQKTAGAGDASIYAVSPDGQRFYYNSAKEGRERPVTVPLTVTLNWLPR